MNNPANLAHVVTEAAGAVTRAMRDEHHARIERLTYEAAVVDSLVGQANPMTGKPHSASSAAALAETDPGTLARRADVLNAECQTFLARAHYQAVLLSMWRDVYAAAGVPAAFAVGAGA